MNLRSWRIGARLGAGFGMSLIILIVSLGITSAFIQEERNLLAQHASQSSENMAIFAAMKAAVLETRIAALEAAQSDQPAVHQSQIQALLKKYVIVHPKFKGVIGEAEKPLLTEIDSLIEKLQGIDQKLDRNSTGIHQDGEPSLQVLALKIIDRIDRAELAQRQADKLSLDLLTQRMTRTLVWLIGLGAFFALLGGLVAWRLTLSITAPLRTAVSIARRVANGDLSSQPVITGNDEVSDLLTSLKTMNDNLRKLVGEVRQSTDSIAIASREIAAGNSDLSSRTENQAQSLSQTAASMENLTAAVTANAANARTANENVAASSDIARRGNESVHEVMRTMQEIKDSSRRVAEITSVVDSIAFQTNILALNAAVEAARAGESGQGFAVVASEVRSLAQRAAAAAKEIKLLTSDSQDKVDAGSAMVTRAGQTMEEILASVHSINTLIGSISQASQEQASTIEGVNLAIVQMDETTQKNAALVEEAAAAAMSMQEQAAELAKAVSVFRLESNTDEAVRMVKRAVALIREKGKEAAFAAFNKPGPNFRSQDLYINVIDTNGNTLAHGDNNKLIGKNLLDLKDADGKPFIREFIATASSASSGWVDYRWPNPLTGIVEAKSTYVEKIDNYVVGCGIYK